MFQFPKGKLTSDKLKLKRLHIIILIILINVDAIVCDCSLLIGRMFSTEVDRRVMLG